MQVQSAVKHAADNAAHGGQKNVATTTGAVQIARASWQLSWQSLHSPSISVPRPTAWFCATRCTGTLSKIVGVDAPDAGGTAAYRSGAGNAPRRVERQPAISFL